MSRDGSKLRIYRNGVLVTSTASVPAGASHLQGSIGAVTQDQYPEVYAMHGCIDEVALYAFALSADAVGLHYRGAGNAGT
jgi:hypothetical protein